MALSASIDQITAGTAAAVSQSVSNTSKATLGKDDFLKLFVTKLSNQDPSQPMQDENFIAQMAQFTQLEQMQNMNTNLENALASDLTLSQTISNTMATSLIGRSVRVQADSVVLDQTGVANISFDLDKAAANVTAEISNADGSLVRTLSMDGATSGTHEMTWDGLDAQGSPVAAGQYNLKITATDADGKAVKATAYFNGKVDGVRYVDGSGMLTIGNVLVPLSSVLEVHT